MEPKKVLTSAWMIFTFAGVFMYGFCQADRTWNQANDPRNLDPNYNFNFYQLPPSGDVTTTNTGWSDSYWPKTRGYILDRWQDELPIESRRFKFREYILPTANQVQNMGPSELKRLSPAEKFDILRGELNFPIANRIKKMDLDQPFQAEDWWRGLCAGWTHASLNFPEPHPIIFDSKKFNVKVPLGSSDIKGLLSYYFSFHDPNRFNNMTKRIGIACPSNDPNFLDLDGACKDMNAGAFHVALANQIGLKKRGLAIDRNPTAEVWNQPFVKYKSTVYRVVDAASDDLSPGASANARKEIYVTTIATYVDELFKDAHYDADEDDQHSEASYEPVLGTDKQSAKTLTYKYVLELDARDNIIGGDWTPDDTTDPHPDFIWQVNDTAPTKVSDQSGATDDWSLLEEIVLEATKYMGVRQ